MLLHSCSVNTGGIFVLSFVCTHLCTHLVIGMFTFCSYCSSCNIMLKYMLCMPLIVSSFHFISLSLLLEKPCVDESFYIGLTVSLVYFVLQNKTMQFACMYLVIISSYLMIANLLLVSAIYQLGTRIPSAASPAVINARTPPKKPSIGQKKPLEAHGSSPPLPR